MTKPNPQPHSMISSFWARESFDNGNSYRSIHLLVRAVFLIIGHMLTMSLLSFSSKNNAENFGNHPHGRFKQFDIKNSVCSTFKLPHCSYNNTTTELRLKETGLFYRISSGIPDHDFHLQRIFFGGFHPPAQSGKNPAGSVYRPCYVPGYSATMNSRRNLTRLNIE